MRNPVRRTEVVIDLSALEHNAELIRSKIGNDTQLMAVLKGNAYGHGAVGVYPTLKKSGVECYAVSVWKEGAALRKNGCTEPILILGDTHDEEYENLIKYDLTPTIFTYDAAEKLSAAASRSNTVLPVNIKIDTGMSRIGLPANEESADLIKKISLLPGIKITGVFTHFARADEPDGIAAKKQLEKYLYILDLLKSKGVDVPMRHTANSPAILLRPESYLDAVRAGDILFGLCPVDEDIWEKEDFRQVLSWYTYVVMVKEVPAGTEVGYGGTFVTDKPTKIATIPVGFADGYSRRLSNKGYVMIHGKKAPVLGRVCMNQFMVDVTDIPEVKRGDKVGLIDNDMTILKMADLTDANVDEIVCAIPDAVPRVYRD